MWEYINIENQIFGTMSSEKALLHFLKEFYWKGAILNEPELVEGLKNTLAFQEAIFDKTAPMVDPDDNTTLHVWGPKEYPKRLPKEGIQHCILSAIAYLDTDNFERIKEVFKSILSFRLRLFNFKGGETDDPHHGSLYENVIDDQVIMALPELAKAILDPDDFMNMLTLEELFIRLFSTREEMLSYVWECRDGDGYYGQTTYASWIVSRTVFSFYKSMLVGKTDLASFIKLSMKKIQQTKLLVDNLSRIDEFVNYVEYLRSKMTGEMKCLILDCDGVLWEGVIGEGGLNGIKITYDYIAFQQQVKKLKEKGIILAINSKNNPEDILEVLEKHPDMVLKKDDFVIIKANWQDKATNIRQIAQELSVGIDSLVFIDDNTFEIESIRNQIPEAITFGFPKDSYRRMPFFLELLDNVFEKKELTNEDKLRNDSYKAQKLFEEDKARVKNDSLEDFLLSCDMVIDINLAKTRDDLERAAQLTQRTNQFNFTTKRYTGEQMEQFYNSNDYKIYIMNFEYKYEDLGRVGLIILHKVENNIWEIDTFCASCRILAQLGFENPFKTFMSYLVKVADKQNIYLLRGIYIPTDKNGYVSSFYDLAGRREDKSRDDMQTWLIDTKKLDIKLPAWIRVIDSGSSSPLTAEELIKWAMKSRIGAISEPVQVNCLGISEELLQGLKALRRFDFIMFELIENAVMHGKMPVEVNFNLSGENIIIEVKDNGPGIDFEKLIAVLRESAINGWAQERDFDKGMPAMLIPRNLIYSNSRVMSVEEVEHFIKESRYDIPFVLCLTVRNQFTASGGGLNNSRMHARSLGGDINYTTGPQGSTFSFSLPLSRLAGTKSSSPVASDDKIKRHIESLSKIKDDYLEERPDEILHSISPRNNYKVRKGWWQILIIAFEYIAIDESIVNKEILIKIRDFVKKYTGKEFRGSSGRDATKEDIRIADDLIVEVINVLKEKIVSSPVADPEKIIQQIRTYQLDNGANLMTRLNKEDLSALLNSQTHTFVNSREDDSLFLAEDSYYCGVVWTIDTPFLTMQQRFNIDFVDNAMKIWLKQRHTPVIFDWGCGDGTTLREMSHKLNRCGIPADLFGYANLFFPNWKLAPKGIVFILDTFNYLPCYLFKFLMLGTKIDILYSLNGLVYLNSDDRLQHLSDLRPFIQPTGLIVCSDNSRMDSVDYVYTKRQTSSPVDIADVLGDMPGVSIVMRKEDFSGQCLSYVRTFYYPELIGNGYEVGLIVTRDFDDVAASEAAPGDLVVYYNDNGILVHVGVLRDDGRIEAKFGNNHVYAYPWDAFLNFYGDPGFRRRKFYIGWYLMGRPQ